VSRGLRTFRLCGGGINIVRILDSEAGDLEFGFWRQGTSWDAK